ncbi:MAG: flagellar type III secretion system pore protein FliP [Thermodesulfobacteriota bacterium]
MKRSWWTGLALIVLIHPSYVYGVDTLPAIGDLSSQLGGEGGVATTIQIVLLLTALTLIPAVLLMMTSFTRFIIVLSLLRHAMGLQQSPPNQVILGLSLFLTFFVMSPVLNQAYVKGVAPYLNQEVDYKEAVTMGLEPFRAFMFKQTGEKEIALFAGMSGMEQPKSRDEVPTRVVIPAFITSELKTAFQVGFIIFIPFLLIDMVVASVLMSMGMMMLPPILISLPFKLMLFVLVDGWNLLVGSMVGGVHL